MSKPPKFEHPRCEECNKKLEPWKLGSTREEWLWKTCDTCFDYVCDDCSEEDPETGKVTCSSCMQTEALIRKDSMVILSQSEFSEFRFDPNSTTNEGRWRLQDPKIFSKYFRRKSSTPGISYVMGVDEHNRAIIQAIRFDKNVWSEEDAAAWWEENKDKYDKAWTQEDWDNLSGDE